MSKRPIATRSGDRSGPLPEFLTKKDLAHDYQCSERHIDRLVAGGLLPRPIRCGQLLRWPRKQHTDWVAQQVASLIGGAN